jgi:ubiquinone/menaquinone biosynthesis C-methylase UbiE
MSEADERERIEQVYRRRDAAGGADSYAFTNPAYVFGMHELESALLRALSAAAVDLGGPVLDVGCGSGYYLSRLQEYGASEAVGVELMDERVAQARRRYPGLDVRQGDAANLPFDDGTFALVTQFTVLSSILDRDSRAAIAREMLRVTRPGGHVLSLDMLPTPRVRRLVAAARQGRTPAGTPVAGLVERDLTALFGAAPVATRRFAFHMGLAPVLRRSRLAAQVMVALPPARTHLVAVFRG